MTKTRASVPAAALSFIAALAYLFFTWFEHSRSVRPSFELEMYLFFATLLNTARARTLWLLDLNSATVPAVFTTSMVIQAVGLLFESWEKRPALREPWSKWAAESLGGTFNRSFFFWLNSLLFLGSRQLLTLSDLPPLDTKLDPERLQSELQEAWDSGRSV